MMYLIDTDIAIYLRDGHHEISRHADDLPGLPAISMMTRVELEGGIHRDPLFASARRAAVDALVGVLEVKPVNDAVIDVYGRIVAACGFSRPKIIDRLIAATALVNDLTLVTVNAADFRDIPGLRLEHWPAPGQ